MQLPTTTPWDKYWWRAEDTRNLLSQLQAQDIVDADHCIISFCHFEDLGAVHHMLEQQEYHVIDRYTWAMDVEAGRHYLRFENQRNVVDILVAYKGDISPLEWAVEEKYMEVSICSSRSLS